MYTQNVGTADYTNVQIAQTQFYLYILRLADLKKKKKKSHKAIH